jgi:hypothetical protein
LNQTVALADDDTRRTLCAMSAEVQAALALSRAMLQALAALSPTLNAAAEQALEKEADVARQLAAPQRVIDLIEDARTQLSDIPEQLEMMGALERALVAAADALPDIRDLEAAERAAGRGG